MLLARSGALRKRHDALIEEQEARRLENLAENPDDAVDFYEETADEEEFVRNKKRCLNTLKPKLYKLLGIKEEVVDADDVNPCDVIEDYYSNPEYHSNLPIVVKLYLHASKRCFDMINYDETFNNVIVITIIIAGILVGLQTYAAMAESVYVNYIDFVVLGIFTIECLTKMLMEGLRPYRYFTGPEYKWNCFDFVIVMLSFPFWNFGGGGSIALLRLVRLARLGKLIRKIPPLQMIVQGLFGGLKSITYIMLLLLLIMYLYSVMAFYTFGLNDPFHFGTVPLSMITLFRVSTLANWGDLMFLNTFGCDNPAYMNVYVLPQDETPDNKQFWCRHPSTQYVLGPALFVSFVVICSFVMLSLFIGAVTLSMNESMDELKSMQEEKKKAVLFKKNKAKLERATLLVKVKEDGSKASPTDSPVSPTITTAKRYEPTDQQKYMVQSDSSSTDSKANDDIACKVLLYEDADVGNDKYVSTVDKADEDVDIGHYIPSGQTSIARTLLRYINPLVLYRMYREQRDREEDDESYNRTVLLSKELRRAMGDEIDGITTADKDHDGKMNPLLLNYCQLGDAFDAIAKHRYFQNLVTFAILVASCNVGAQTDNRVLTVPVFVDVLNTLDLAILIIFTIEILLKFVACKLTPMTYFKDNWNKFDFLIVAGSWSGAGSAVTLLRLLRLLRVLKLVKRLPQLAIIINALMMGLGSIGWVGLVLFLFFYVFAIIGMILFSVNDPHHYGTLHTSLINLFRVATLDDWAELMYINQYGCDKFLYIYEDYPWECKDPLALGIVAVVFNLIFVVIGAQVLLTLFIGVISTSMDASRELNARDMAVDVEVEKMKKKMGLPDDRVVAFRNVFNMLDLDGGGTIEMEELQIGLAAIEANISDEQLEEYMDIVDPKREGINAAQLIKFMSLTPLYKQGALLGSVLQIWKKKADKPKKHRYVQMFEDCFYGGSTGRDVVEEIEAAFLITTTIRKYLQKLKAKRVIEEKRKLFEEKRRMSVPLVGLQPQ